MPAQIEILEDCASNYGTFEVLGSKGDKYTVTFSGSEGPAHCTCKAFEFSKDQDCKHIRQVWKQACLYNPQWHDGQVNPILKPIAYNCSLLDSKCPVCAGPAVAVRRAV